MLGVGIGGSGQLFLHVVCMRGTAVAVMCSAHGILFLVGAICAEIYWWSVILAWWVFVWLDWWMASGCCLFVVSHWNISCR